MDLQSTWIRSERCMRVDEKMLKDARKLLKFGVKYDFKLFEYTGQCDVPKPPFLAAKPQGVQGSAH